MGCLRRFCILEAWENEFGEEWGGGEERMKGVSKKILEEVGKDGKPNL